MSAGDRQAIAPPPPVRPAARATFPATRSVVIAGALALVILLATIDPLLGLLGILGFIGAFVSGLVGVGGAIIMIPLLLYIPPVVGFDALDIRTVAAITIVQVAVAGLVGIVGHRGRIERSLVVAIGLTMTAASFAGAVASAIVDPLVLEVVFATMATLAAVVALLRRGLTAPDRAGPLGFNKPAAAVLGGGVGFLAGMVGAGGAFLLMPAMLFGLHIPMRAAVGASLGIVAISASAGLLGKVATGQIDWLLAAALVVGVIPGGMIGALVSHRTRVDNLATVLGVVVALVAIRMWIGILA